MNGPVVITKPVAEFLQATLRDALEEPERELQRAKLLHFAGAMSSPLDVDVFATSARRDERRLEAFSRIHHNENTPANPGGDQRGALCPARANLHG